MKEDDLEGTLVLEKLAEIGKVDAFFEAVDSDDFGKAQALMAQEKARTAEQMEQKANAKLQLDNQISQLEGEISSRKQTVQEMRQRLDQKIKLTPRP